MNEYEKSKFEMIGRAKKRCEKSGRECTVTIHDFDYGENCQCCGFSMFPKGTKIDATKFMAYPALDRIDNQKGYILGNIAVICTHCNYVKGKWQLEDLEPIVRYMRRNLYPEP